MSKCIKPKCDGIIKQGTDEKGEIYYECSTCGYKRYPAKSSKE